MSGIRAIALAAAAPLCAAGLAFAEGPLFAVALPLAAWALSGSATSVPRCSPAPPQP